VFLGWKVDVMIPAPDKGVSGVTTFEKREGENRWQTTEDGGQTTEG
jgi:hypothetical protein